MKGHLLAALTLMPLIALTAQQPPADAHKAGTARIAGRVVAADSGKPLRGAVMRLLSFTVEGVNETSATDAQGRFEFAGLAPGRYQLEASKEGYLGLQFGQRRPPEPDRPIDLLAGEQFDKADFSLPRAGAIEGALMDEFGDPAPNILVQVSRLDYVAGRRRLMPIGSQNTARPTDDKGQFRVYGLAPGDYYVSALSGAFTEQNETGGFAPTYYPGTPDAASARVVRVGVGESAEDIKFSLVPARMARISGTVFSEGGQPVRATLILTQSDRLGVSEFLAARGRSNADGSFTFRNVPPGRFVVQAFGPSPNGALGQSPFGWMPVTINGEDQIGLDVKLSPDVVIRGRIVFDGNAPQPKPNEVSVFPMPIEFDSAPVVGGGPPRSTIRDDWTFEVGNMSGLRVFQVNVRSPGWTLKSVTLDGKDVTDTPLDFRKGKDIDGIEVVLTSRAASVSGGVIDGNGQPTTSCNVIVFAADTAKWPFPSRFVRLARPSQDGRYKLQGLPPADYLAVALPAIQGTEWQDPEFLERLRPMAKALTLSEGEARTLDLKLTIQR